ncbi:uncharacterized protein EDB93DRAFT_1107232 [Suillus bovinus]|uniref:uncharacterized protein n=1 Tax=Suillus bovinus TaxID=48563 RepID=UPI001B862F21|nr:uncharacterized protein EDB93DRAFT_1107232 [Suillus bovinus]KAG2134901.1 hypothetical protein EDB93DRAFT_1107232 [Suillus bovinus]
MSAVRTSMRGIHILIWSYLVGPSNMQLGLARDAGGRRLEVRCGQTHDDKSLASPSSRKYRVVLEVFISAVRAHLQLAVRSFLHILRWLPSNETYKHRRQGWKMEVVRENFRIKRQLFVGGTYFLWRVSSSDIRLITKRPNQCLYEQGNDAIKQQTFLHYVSNL